MDPVRADCRKDFYPAAHASGARPLNKITLVVLHDGETLTAASIARWFQNPESQGSAHLAVDDDVCYRCLPNTAVPWGAPGANLHGFHIEQAGKAAWTRDQWLEHRPTINRAAYKTAYHCSLFNIPPRLLTVAQLKAGASGITTHARCSLAFGGDHTDPGAGYPLDVLMARVRYEYARLVGA